MVLVFAERREGRVEVVPADKPEDASPLALMTAFALNGCEGAKNMFGYLAKKLEPTQPQLRQGNELLKLHELGQAQLLVALTKKGINNAAEWVKYFSGEEYDKNLLQQDAYYRRAPPPCPQSRGSSGGSSRSFSSRGGGFEREDFQSEYASGSLPSSRSQRDLPHEDSAQKRSSHKHNPKKGDGGGKKGAKPPSTRRHPPRS